MDPSTGVKRRCDEEATRVVEENNANMGLYVSKSITENYQNKTVRHSASNHQLVRLVVEFSLTYGDLIGCINL